MKAWVRLKGIEEGVWHTVQADEVVQVVELDGVIEVWMPTFRFAVSYRDVKTVMGKIARAQKHAMK